MNLSIDSIAWHEPYTHNHLTPNPLSDLKTRRRGGGSCSNGFHRDRYDVFWSNGFVMNRVQSDSRDVVGRGRRWTVFTHFFVWKSIMYVLCTFVTLRDSGVHPLLMASTRFFFIGPHLWYNQRTTPTTGLIKQLLSDCVFSGSVLYCIYRPAFI